MTQQELQEIEERWKFGTNTREDVRKLIDEVELRWSIENEAEQLAYDRNLLDDGGGNDF